MTENNLPHDEYMTAVAAALAAYGVEPTQWWTSDESGSLDAVFQWEEGTAHPEHWPHGVHLTWDQESGWCLVESGGPRNVDRLSPDSRTYGEPLQVAADAHARLTRGPDGRTPGPICMTGNRWDSRPTQAAVERWEASAA